MSPLPSAEFCCIRDHAFDVIAECKVGALESIRRDSMWLAVFAMRRRREKRNLTFCGRIIVELGSERYSVLMDELGDFAECSVRPQGCFRV